MVGRISNTPESQSPHYLLKLWQAASFGRQEQEAAGILLTPAVSSQMPVNMHQLTFPPGLGGAAALNPV